MEDMVFLRLALYRNIAVDVTQLNLRLFVTVIFFYKINILCVFFYFETILNKNSSNKCRPKNELSAVFHLNHKKRNSILKMNTRGNDGFYLISIEAGTRYPNKWVLQFRIRIDRILRSSKTHTAKQNPF